MFLPRILLGSVSVEDDVAEAGRRFPGDRCPPFALRCDGDRVPERRPLTRRHGAISWKTAAVIGAFIPFAPGIVTDRLVRSCMPGMV